MSLLYECINGVIHGGLLDGAEAGSEAEQIANLCVEKLRGMLVMEGDPNCMANIPSDFQTMLIYSQ